MIIEVTQEDINKGEQCDGNSCAIALALKREHPELEACNVTGFGIFEDDNQRNVIFRATKKMSQFIRKFDKDRTSVKPTKFRIMKESK